MQDLVVRGAGVGILEIATPGDMAPSPESSSAMGSRKSGPYLPGSPSSPPPPSIN
jgi:hypothetical protein